ncbi:malectin domain-containing carbohydrate-binding protein [Oleiharenicola lentus]|uniref:malectin domain-containing carbohydrate-binding protein n=1 Tax=Oleiharenicola lentus TaxID=2508720 RepID=UPI0013E9722E|nr:malectin domain-containing carbohydrate-binding protein [Oleiharenicola lentus]
MNTGWRTIADDDDRTKYDGFEQPGYDDSSWQRVDVPHNWDDYGGARRLVHGNRHGYAWYRRSFEIKPWEKGRRAFLFFEGVGSYATVWVNGKLAGKHAGGRTTFTLDVTDLLKSDGPNLLAVRADHPAGITDLPWVCGGCSTAVGFSEGSQPMGIFRPVWIETTGHTRVEPFGVHVWNDGDATATSAKLHVAAEVRNYGLARKLKVTHVVVDGPRIVMGIEQEFLADEGLNTVKSRIDLKQIELWSPESPRLYGLVTMIYEGSLQLDAVHTYFGIRTVQWPKPDDPLPAPFRLNGQPVFLNGTCEYEHLLGNSHAFTDEQIAARVDQTKATGFNAMRDAHQPHNLRYQDHWDREGILWWPQFISQIWFDTPEFRANFKTLLREWVRERRNNPSNVLWGLANESKLPEDFARECVAIIRELDPTAVDQRIVTTCNGGTGTDWNVPQNWTGTYGGDPATYAEDLKKQKFIGEYGAWRSLGLHSEGGYIADGVRSEDRADAIFAMKIRLAESIRDQVPGHFHWLLATHDNPGRTIGAKGQQGTDGWAELDRIGPANNKGLLTLWGEPTDAYHLYRASYVSAAKDPMVYIVSHTWPDRWTEPGKKSGILVYSNCEEVELFNGTDGRESLGVRRQGGPGVPFRWDDVHIRFNVLTAVGRVGGKVVARDAVVLQHLPAAPGLETLRGTVTNLTAADPAWNYLYRVNCGGPDYTDGNGVRWAADRDFVAGLNSGSTSWAMAYPGVAPRLGSQRASAEVIRGTDDQALFQAYRYGREKLRYRFAVPDGDYRVELYFMEPWYGAGGGNCAGWRLFDVAINGDTVLRNLDLWQEAGFAGAVKKVVNARVSGGWLEVSFPRVASYQAVISAIAIAAKDPAARAPAETAVAVTTSKAPSTDAAFSLGEATYPVSAAKRDGNRLSWTITLGLGGGHDFALRYVNPGPEPLTAELQVTALDGTVMGKGQLSLELTPGATATVADLGMNAGDYTVTVTLPGKGAVKVEALIVR